MSTSPAGRRQAAGLLVAIVALPACPQLLSDEFRAPHPADDTPEAGQPRPSGGDPSRGDADGSRDEEAGAGGTNGSSWPAPFDTLLHRYRFDGTGVRVLDSVGAAHGDLIGAALTGTGALTLPGGSTAAYVNLPNGLISVLSDVTLEAWLVWRGGADWQRVFDFGSSTLGEDQSGSGTSYLFFTPSAAELGLDMPRVGYSTAGYGAEVRAAGQGLFPSQQLVHVAVVVDDTNDQLALYIDGQPSASVAFTGTLRALRDENNWLGRSQYDDPALDADLLEFRVHASALGPAAIALSHTSGPDPALLEP